MRGRTRRLASAAAATLAGLCAALLISSSAAAHVTVNPREASQGGFAALASRTPNERDDASTVKLSVAFPADTPIAFVSVRPHPGWSYQVTKAKLAQPIQGEGGEITEAVSTITWSAAGPGQAIKPGEYDEFSVSVGPLPEGVDQLVSKANQTYSSGEVVRWIEEAAPGSQEEPEHPAPTLTLLPATDADASPTPAANAQDAQGGQTQVESGADTGLVYTALALGALGALAGLAALGIALRARRPGSAAEGRGPSHTP